MNRRTTDRGLNDAGRLYELHQPLLLALAYRLLGSVMDAEDIVHDVFIDWEQVQSDANRSVDQAKAYLCKMVTNRCIDLLRSARYRREHYVGEWLPEPYVAADSDPLVDVLTRDSVSIAYLLMLELLTPVERAVIVLREALDLDYAEIAEYVDKTPDNCRQILRRAKQKLRDRGEPEGASATANAATLARFLTYVTEGNVAGLTDLMLDDAVLLTDSGGRVTAALNPIAGNERIVRYLLGLVGKLPESGIELELAEINGAPGLILYAGADPYCTLAFAYRDEAIAAAYMTVNPDKMRHLSRGH